MNTFRIASIAALLVTLPLTASALAGETLHSDAAVPFMVGEERPQAPFGQTMPDVVHNYSRAAPGVGTAGMISSGGMKAFADNGFKTVVSLLTPSEGGDVHGGWAISADIAYHNLSVTSEGPDDSVLARFKDIMADPDNYPVVVYCSSANRVGALWARYRIAMGVHPEVAFQEGRTIGLTPSLEQTVREKHGY